MRVDTERSRHEYRIYHGRKYDDRLKRRNYRNDDYPPRKNGSYSSRGSLKSRHDYPPSNRKFHDTTHSSSRFDRPMNNRDIYPPLITDQLILSSGPPPAALYYNSSQSLGDRSLSSHYIESERNRYPPSQSSSSTYRRNSSPSPAYRNDYVSRTNNNDLYIRDEYRAPAPLSARSTVDSYNDVYRANDYNTRSERYEVAQNRNGSSRDYPSPVYCSDPYRTSSVIPMPSPPPLSSSSSSYISRDQYAQSLPPPMREIDYRTRDYGMTLSMDHHQATSNASSSSDRYHDDYNPSCSYRDRSNLKRSRTGFNENEAKRPMRR